MHLYSSRAAAAVRDLSPDGRHGKKLLHSGAHDPTVRGFLYAWMD